MRNKKNSKKRAQQKRLLLGLIAIGMLIFFLILVQGRNSGMVPYVETKITPGEGILSIPKKEYNFGTVKLSAGVVSTSFPLVNLGEGDLTINFLDSSCSCTTAKIVNGGKAGPVFGMSSHGSSPRDWQTTIEPGEKAELIVYYDPSVHPDFRGSATRVITIFSNDMYAKKKSVKIKVYQTE